MILERISKLLVVASTLAALFMGAWLGAREWAPLLPLTAALFVGGLIAGRLWGSRAWIPVLATASILPAVFLLTRGAMAPAYWNSWLAALAGGVLANLDFRHWTFPPRWKWPLAYWALVVALTWPFVIAREADFSWALMSRYNLANSGLGGPPPVIAVWILSVVMTQLLGLLFLDAAFVVFPLGDRATSLRAFTRHVLWPLAIGVILGGAVAIYQGTIDINWLNGHQWPYYNRASGSLDDGNAFGPLAGMWTGALLAIAASSRRMAIRAIAIVGAIVACAGLWATGSRMALLAALICFAFAAWFVVRRRQWSRRDLASIGIPALCVLAALAFFVAQSSTTSPIQRVRDSLPGLTRNDLHRFVTFELWNRFGPFGTAAVEMVTQYPVSGVGVGCFNHIFPDYAFALTGDRAHMDNAQSWYRQQLAELGVAGSLGWLLWLPMLGWVLIRTRGDIDQRFAATMVKSSLVAIGIVSAISLTQSFPVALTLWVLVFWYLLLSGDATTMVTKPDRLSEKPVWGALAWMSAIAVVAATLWTGWRDLRPPYRAIMANWTYQVGFYPPQTSESGQRFRWTEPHAMMVLPAAGRWLKLTVSGGPPDIGDRPLRVEVRRRGKKIIAVTRLDRSAMTWYVRNTANASRMMLEFDVSPGWRPSDPDRADNMGELGVAVDDWTFVEAPPPGAVAIR